MHFFQLRLSEPEISKQALYLFQLIALEEFVFFFPHLFHSSFDPDNYKCEWMFGLCLVHDCCWSFKYYYLVLYLVYWILMNTSGKPAQTSFGLHGEVHICMGVVECVPKGSSNFRKKCKRRRKTSCVPFLQNFWGWKYGTKGIYFSDIPNRNKPPNLCMQIWFKIT